MTYCGSSAWNCLSPASVYPPVCVCVCVCVRAHAPACACVHTCMHAQLLSPVWLFAAPWPVAHQAPLSMGFPRQEYWSGLSFPSPEETPHGKPISFYKNTNSIMKPSTSYMIYRIFMYVNVWQIMYKFVFNMCYIQFIKQLWINNRYIISLVKWHTY